MKLSALTLAACLALLVGGPGASIGISPPPPTELLAFEWGAGLVRVDPLTLRRKGKPLVTVRPAAHAFDPDGGRVALQGDNGPLELVDVRGWRKLGRFPSLASAGWIETLVWAERDRIVALARSLPAYAVVLDPDSLRVVSKTKLPGAAVAVARARATLAVLSGPQEGIGPSRLHVVDGLGRARTVNLPRVRSGWTTDGRRLTPGLALDPAGHRAVVIQPAGPAAEVDLATLRVAYHELTRARSPAARLHDWLEPRAHAKEVVGPELWARWVGERGVAIASWEHTGIDERSGEYRALVRAHGIFLVDTRNWTQRSLSETASGIEAVGDTALVYAGPFAAGRPFGADQGRPPTGLDAYGPNGRRRFRLFGSRVVGRVEGAGAYAYARVSERVRDVIDVRTGRVLGRAHTTHDLWLLPRD